MIKRIKRSLIRKKEIRKLNKRGICIAEHASFTNTLFDDYVNLAHHAEVSNSTVGLRTSIGRYSKVQNAEIGKYCSISWDVTIGALSHPFDSISSHAFSYRKQFGLVNENEYLNQKKTVLGNDVWVGCGAIIIAGVTIGDGAVIGAGAVVTKDVMPYEIVAGVPAKHIRNRFSQKTIEVLLDNSWWDLPDEVIRKHIDLLGYKNSIDDNEGALNQLRSLFLEEPTEKKGTNG